MSNISNQNLLIFNSRKIILELMEQQNYNTLDYKNFSLNEVSTMIKQSQLDMLLDSNPDKDNTDNNKKKIYIKFNFDAKLFTVAKLNYIIDDLFVHTKTLEKNDTLFIIQHNEANETLKDELKNIWDTKEILVVIQTFKRLQFNILNNILVPPHRVMSKSEVEIVMKKYNIENIMDFPEISRFDPVAQVICLRPGEVCHIIRPSKTAITTNYYRVCI